MKNDSTPKEEKTYCVEIHRECEEVCVKHYKFDHEPSYIEVLDKIDAEDMGYDDDYGKFSYWEVK